MKMYNTHLSFLILERKWKKSKQILVIIKELLEIDVIFLFENSN